MSQGSRGISVSSLCIGQPTPISFAPRLLQMPERAVVMAFAAAEAGALRIDRDQRHEDQVGLDHRRAPLRLHDSERARLQRVAGMEAERLGGIGKGRESDDPADRPSFFHRAASG